MSSLMRLRLAENEGKDQRGIGISLFCRQGSCN